MPCLFLLLLKEKRIPIHFPRYFCMLVSNIKNFAWIVISNIMYVFFKLIEIWLMEVAWTRIIILYESLAKMFPYILGYFDYDADCWRCNSTSCPYSFKYKNIFGNSWTNSTTCNNDFKAEKVSKYFEEELHI